MQRQRGTLACAAGLSLACAAGSTSPPAVASYTATLTGSHEVPAVITPANGIAGFMLSGTTITYTITAAGFSTPLVVGHVHFGASGEVGPVIVPFSIVAQSGTVASGVINVGAPVTYGNITISGDSLRRLFENGTAYVNLHTAAFPGGEIRGQVVSR